MVVRGDSGELGGGVVVVGYIVPFPLTIIEETFSDDCWAQVAFCFQVGEPFIRDDTEFFCYQRVIDWPAISECLIQQSRCEREYLCCLLRRESVEQGMQ
jgi:hypothetical protein